LKKEHLAVSQVVVCKIHEPPLLVPHALLPTISFHLLRVVLAIFPPVGAVRPAPLPRTLQADLLIHRIGSNPLPMIIGAPSPLARSLAANLLLWMIKVRLKALLTVVATTILHQVTPEENGRGSFFLEAHLDLDAQAKNNRGETSIEFSTASHADGPQTVFRLQWRQHDSSFNRDTCARKDVIIMRSSTVHKISGSFS